MRHFVLALMIALLPLRGWVGDAMAMELASETLEQPVSAIESGANHAHAMMVAADSDAKTLMHADCQEHAPSPDDSSQAASDCETCTSCQICHTVALTPTLPQLAAASVPAARPQAASTFFASAERAPGFKPPIS
jgi:hypothetical protein